MGSSIWQREWAPARHGACVPEAGTASRCAVSPQSATFSLPASSADSNPAHHRFSPLEPVELGKLLSYLPRHWDPDLPVGFENADDAGVYRINPEQALVMTADFVAPAGGDQTGQELSNDDHLQ